MDDVWSIAFLTSVLAAAIPAGTAILYACLGELLCERAGILNLGVEGMMLMGALGGFAVSQWTDSAWLGAIGALVVGGAMALDPRGADDHAAGESGRQRPRPDDLWRRSLRLPRPQPRR